MNKQAIWDGLRRELSQFVGDKNTELTQLAMCRMARNFLLANVEKTEIDPDSLEVIQCAKDKTFIHICHSGQVPDDGCRP